MMQAAKIIGTGLATTGLIGAGVAIEVVFGALILGVAKNPSLGGQLFSYAILGFAFAEATGLFALMMALFALMCGVNCSYNGMFVLPSFLSFGWEDVARWLAELCDESGNQNDAPLEIQVDEEITTESAPHDGGPVGPDDAKVSSPSKKKTKESST